MKVQLYKKYETVIGTAMEKAAEESCMQAAVEERKLVLENVKKLCEKM